MELLKGQLINYNSNDYFSIYHKYYTQSDY